MRDLSNDIVIQINKNGLSYLQFKVLNNLEVPHAFILKCDDFNLKPKEKAYTASELTRAYKGICDSLNIDVNNIVRPFQKHTANVKYIDKVYEGFLLDSVDGLITDKKDIILATTNADCIIYLLYDKQKKIIANIHSGWRGSYQRIIENTIDVFLNELGSNPEDIIVCIAPSIRKCCFEVDEDVKDMFYERFSFVENLSSYIINGYKPGKYFIDTVRTK